jgi:hypothetical protein
MNKWITWETSTHYLVTEWGGPGAIIKNTWVKKQNENEPGNTKN